MLQTLLLLLHVIVAVSLIALILLQQGRGAATGAAFGSGASSTFFGARGSASFLSRTTAILAAVFLANCLLLAFIAGRTHRPDSMVDQLARATQKTLEIPAAPTPADKPQPADLPKIPATKP